MRNLSGLLILSILVMLNSLNLIGQDESAFSSKTNLKPGIYTNVTQIYQNAPKYLNYKINLTEYFSFNVYYNSEGNKVYLEEKPLLYVNNHSYWIDYKRRLNKLILVGTISTFIVDHTADNIDLLTHGTNAKSAVEFYYFDLVSGLISLVDEKTICAFLERDIELYNQYMSLKKRKRKKYFTSTF